MLTHKQTVNLLQKFVHNEKTVKEYDLAMSDLTRVAISSYGGLSEAIIYFKSSACTKVGIGNRAAFKYQKLTEANAILLYQSINRLINTPRDITEEDDIFS